MKTVIQLSILILCAWSCEGANYTAASPSRADVDAAIALASSSGGDNVCVPAGSAIWLTTLSITKPIGFFGTNTHISASVGNGSWLWTYSPANPAADLPFRVSGFMWDSMSNSLQWYVANGDSAHPIHNIRIDHNIFTNNIEEGPNFVTATVAGAVCGVFDHNLTTDGQYWTHCDGNGSNDWQALRWTFGTTNAFYFEDNTYNGVWGITGGEFGSRWVARYNTTLLTATDLFPWMDMHGNQPAGVYAAMGGEAYGNVIYAPNVGANTVRGFHHRGGQLLCYFNQIFQNVGQAQLFVQEEYSDGISPTTNPEPQHVNGSYYWNNRKNGPSGPFWEVAWQTDVTSTNTISPNVSFWTNTPAFDGSFGMGMGLPSNRPAVGADGVAYWATTQDVSTVPATMVGTNPATPISGTLYVYSTNSASWVPYYTPLVYPHPLISAQASGMIARVTNFHVKNSHNGP